MSRKHVDGVGAPHASSSYKPLPPMFRNNLGGQTAFQRESMMVARYGSDKGKGKEKEGKSEWDVLRENHRFIREDEEPENVSWEERLARAYESKLFKEFALIDLKHFKSKRFALRWRTAPEVVEGAGEETCGSLRCKWHRFQPTSASQVDFDDSHSDDSDEPDSRRRRRKRKEKEKEMPPLRTFELPFVYEEAGERKEALVKVKLCPKCQTKLTWKPGKEVDEDEDRNRRKEENGHVREKDRSRHRSRSPRRREKSRRDAG